MYGAETIEAVLLSIAHLFAGIAHQVTGTWVEATSQHQPAIAPAVVTIQKDEKICPAKQKVKPKPTPRKKKRSTRKKKGRR